MKTLKQFMEECAEARADDVLSEVSKDTLNAYVKKASTSKRTADKSSDKLRTHHYDAYSKEAGRGVENKNGEYVPWEHGDSDAAERRVQDDPKHVSNTRTIIKRSWGISTAKKKLRPQSVKVHAAEEKEPTGPKVEKHQAYSKGKWVNRYTGHRADGWQRQFSNPRDAKAFAHSTHEINPNKIN